MSGATLELPGYRESREIRRTWSTRDYAAVEEVSGREVCVRVFDRLDDPSIRAQIEHEVDRLCSLDVVGHPRVRAAGTPGSDLAMVIEAPTLASVTDHCAAGSRIDRALDALLQLAELLAHVHAQGLVHREVAPSAVGIDPSSGTLHLKSWGIGAVIERERQQIHDPWTLAELLPFVSPEQTGRMGRDIDPRSDLYSVGVLGYLWLAGRRPFESNDPLELIHAQLALDPEPLDSLDPQLPAVIVSIIERLMRKAPENRYQTAAGLAHDLRYCLQSWRREGAIANLELCRHDVPASLHLPHQLYGRKEQCRDLLSMFERVAADGTTKVVLIKGEAGIGKTALIQEVQRPIAARRGYFIAGKFDQLKRYLACAALIESLADLARQILAGSETRVASWRERILAQVGGNGRLITDAIPAMEAVIGSQPELPALGSVENQNRFTHTIRQLIGVFARPEHPLVLFLDDLQWADSASLEIIRGLVTDPGAGSLMFLGAYRDNEVDAAHPTRLVLDTIGAEGTEVREVQLRSIRSDDVAAMLADTVGRLDAEVVRLAEVVHQKTEGNPFFVRAFLRALYEQGVLVCHSRDGWQWDLEQITGTVATENVVNLLARQIARYSGAAAETLACAAALGNSFRLTDLANAMQTSRSEVLRSLQLAMDAGMLGRVGVTYKFVHDRVQEAAYSLIPSDDRASCRLAIGRRLLAAYGESLDGQLQAVTNHLNHGVGDHEDLLASDSERLLLARLNLRSGRRAKAAAAYEVALRYFAAGLRALPATAAASISELYSELTLQTGEAEYLCGEFAAGAAR